MSTETVSPERLQVLIDYYSHGEWIRDPPDVGKINEQTSAALLDYQRLSQPSPEARGVEVQRAIRALNCLALELPESIWRDAALPTIDLLRSLETRLGEAQKDAGRYRWLRKQAWVFCELEQQSTVEYGSTDENYVDAAIDAQRGEGEGK